MEDGQPWAQGGILPAPLYNAAFEEPCRHPCGGNSSSLARLVLVGLAAATAACSFPLSTVMPTTSPQAARSSCVVKGRGDVTPSGYAFPVRVFYGEVQPHWGSVKGGSDLFAPVGTPVDAMRGGVVVFAGTSTIGGHNVTIQGDDGNYYYYAHLQDAPRVKSGQQVESGRQIGCVGNTGNAEGTEPHLHLGIGPRIHAGSGARGGTGGDFDAVDLLRRVRAEEE